MTDPERRLEERIAHLERALEETSDVVAAQAREIEGLKARVARLVARAADEEPPGGIIFGDERPPHW